MSDYAQNPQDYINFHGKDWAVLRSFLVDQQELLVSKLCQDVSPEETSKLRGQLRCVRDLLALEKAAPQSRLQE